MGHVSWRSIEALVEHELTECSPDIVVYNVAMDPANLSLALLQRAEASCLCHCTPAQAWHKYHHIRKERLLPGREFVLFFSVMDEGSSLLLARNVANFLPALAGGATVLEQTSTDEALGVRFPA